MSLVAVDYASSKPNEKTTHKLTDKQCNSFLVSSESIKELKSSGPKTPLQIALTEYYFPPEAEFYTYERKLRMAVYLAHDGIDYYTGQHISFDKMSLDHILPRIKKGQNNVFNYVPTTRLTNSEKGADFFERHLKALDDVRDHYGPRTMAYLKLFGAFENREVTLAKARSYYNSPKEKRQLSRIHTLVELPDIENLKNVVFRRHIDTPSAGLRIVLESFYQQVLELSPGDRNTLMFEKTLQFVVDSRFVSKELNKEKLTLNLSYRKQGAKIETDTLILLKDIFTITHVQKIKGRNDKALVSVTIHPYLVEKILTLKSTFKINSAYSFTNFLLMTQDMERMDFIHWAEN